MSQLQEKKEEVIASLDADDFDDERTKGWKSISTSQYLEDEVKSCLEILVNKCVEEVSIFCLMEKKQVEEESKDNQEFKPRVFRIPINCLQYLPTLAVPFSLAVDPNEPLGIDVVVPSIMEYILEYVLLFKDGVKVPKKPLKPARCGGMHLNTSAEEAVFVDKLWNSLSRNEYFAILRAASYFQCIPLVDLLCCNIAMKAKEAPTVPQIKPIILGLPITDANLDTEVDVNDDESKDEGDSDTEVMDQDA